MDHPVLGHLSNGSSLVGAWTPGIIHRNIQIPIGGRDRLNKLYLKKKFTPKAHFSYPNKIHNQLYTALTIHRKFKLRLNTPKKKTLVVDSP